MTFANESDFEAYLRGEIIKPIITSHKEYYLMESKKAVDILICKNGSNPSLYFIEVKYHKKLHGRLGIGQRKGVGFQPEILSSKPTYFQNNLRWVMGSESHNGFLWLHNDEITEYLNAGMVGGKYNGVRKKIFNEKPLLNTAQLESNLRSWLGVE
ncbi:hypothetical protein GC194_00485 [bacterium]|nr:hypothetical protein [bacterium]